MDARTDELKQLRLEAEVSNLRYTINRSQERLAQVEGELEELKRQTDRPAA